MEPIKPISGNSNNDEGQASALAEVVREGYWKQCAQKTQGIEESEDPSEVTDKRQGQTQTHDLQMRRTYIEFEVNRDTRDVTVRIIDAESGKLLRTLPPDELAKEIIKGNFHPSQLRRHAVLI
jgi:uncharacterized FlaG/YvyC family protein